MTNKFDIYKRIFDFVVLTDQRAKNNLLTVLRLSKRKQKKQIIG